MDPRSSNTLSKDSANNGNNYRQATFFGAAALVGTLSGLRHAGTDHILARIPFTFKKAEFPLAYASVSALVAAVGFYFVKNLDWHSKPETKSQAAITALTIGATTLAGWTSMRYFGSKFMFRGLTEKRLNLAMIMTGGRRWISRIRFTCFYS